MLLCRLKSEKIMFLKYFNIFLFIVSCVLKCVALQDDIYENDVFYDGNENIRFLTTLNELEDVNIEDALQYRITFPCTKWCGPGNDASHPWQLGYCSDTDRCCRSHDMCAQAINAGETKYGLHNTDAYTKMGCDCDLKFRSCLKDVDSYLSNMMGYVYFDYLGDRNQKCFCKKHPSACIKRDNCTTSGRCQVYEYKVDEPMLHQWFDIPRYNDCKD